MPMTAMVKQMILASGSRFRAKMLADSGIAVRIVPAEVDEYAVQHEDPRTLAILRAQAKAREVSLRYPSSLVLGADQTLEFEGKGHDKARTKDQAIERLQMLSGKKHTLHSAFSLFIYSDHQVLDILKGSVEVRLWMHKLTPQEIETYVHETDEWKGTVGCYQYENQGVHLFEKVEGDYFSVVGIPLTEILKGLRQKGIRLLEKRRSPWTLQL